MQSSDYINYIASELSNGNIGISGSCGASGVCGPSGTSGSCGSYGNSGETYKEEKLPILEINEILSYDKINKSKKQTSNWINSHTNMHSLYE